MKAIYSDQSADVGTVSCWVRQFKDGKMGQADLTNKPQSGRPLTASDQLYQDRIEYTIALQTFFKKEQQQTVNITLKLSLH